VQSRIRRAIWSACLMLTCAAAHALPYPDEAQFREAVTVADSYLKSQNIPMELLDARKERVSRPLMSAGLSLRDGVCLIFFNPEPVADVQPFFDAMPSGDFAVLMRALAVHESAHCVEQRDAYLNKEFDKVLPPTIPRDGMNVQGYLSVVRSGAVEAWGEAFADLAALLYLKQQEPDRWVDLARQLLVLRIERAKLDPEHDTSPWISRFIAEQPSPVAGQSIYERAFELRRLYRPSTRPAEASAPAQAQASGQ
jgi:hypothetical protein